MYHSSKKSRNMVKNVARLHVMSVLVQRSIRRVIVNALDVWKTIPHHQISDQCCEDNQKRFAKINDPFPLCLRQQIVGETVRKANHHVGEQK